jgi:hypothetical protein
MTQRHVVGVEDLVGVGKKKIIGLRFQKCLKRSDVIYGRQHVAPQFGRIVDLGATAGHE